MRTLIALVLACAATAAAQEPAPQVPVIVTVGEAVVRRTPDLASAGAMRTVDRVLKIEDSRDAGPGMPRPMMTMVRADVSQTPVGPGVIEIRARVTLTVSTK